MRWEKFFYHDKNGIEINFFVLSLFDFLWAYIEKIMELLRLGSPLNRNKNVEVKMSKKFLTSDPLGVIFDCAHSRP